MAGAEGRIGGGAGLGAWDLEPGTWNLERTAHHYSPPLQCLRTEVTHAVHPDGRPAEAPRRGPRLPPRRAPDRAPDRDPRAGRVGRRRRVAVRNPVLQEALE